MASSASPTRVKICGLSTEATLTAALEAGADWIGLVHFPRSPRHVSLAQAAALAAGVGKGSGSAAGGTGRSRSDRSRAIRSASGWIRHPPACASCG